jgi:5'-nucleotidase
MLTPRARGLFCNRTLNLRSIKAIGYDMDYMLIHYRMEEWERHAYGALRERLADAGWPVRALEFDPELAVRGLVIDLHHGNVVKANRFGYVKSSQHGTRAVPFDVQRSLYSRTLIDLRDGRWRFLNTLFSISECCMYMQLVDLFDAGELPDDVRGYADLYARVRGALDWAHAEGSLKQAILEDPDRFVELDEEMVLALRDQKESGKLLLLITNSEWAYAAPMMRFAVDRFLPPGRTWSDLFDLTIVGAQKPDFFSVRMPAFRVVSDDGLLREHVGKLERGARYVGGHASMVEDSFQLAGEEILYVGDHIFSDVNVSKSVQRWRTALILREIEDEIEALEGFAPHQAGLDAMMLEKTELESAQATARLELQRVKRGYGPDGGRGAAALDAELGQLKARLAELDTRIGPLAIESQARPNRRWGLPMRAGNDKSHLARQVERYADVYTSRVSNFLRPGPYVFLRSPRGSLPHDP